MKSFPLLPGAAALALLLAGCATPSADTEPVDPPVIEHIHGITADPNGGDDLFIATHNGLFSVAPDGVITGPIGAFDFDAMGFVSTGDTLFVSGHPGPATPSDLGTGNLGIIRSDDAGNTWTPIAFTGVEDFHVLTAAPDGTLYGIGSSSPNLLISTSSGETWVGAPPIAAIDLAVTADGIYAATEDGLQISTDNGASFASMDGAPLMYSIDARPDGTLVGAGVDGTLWSQSNDGAWVALDTLSGRVEALSVIGNGQIAVADDRGIVIVATTGSTVISPKR